MRLLLPAGRVIRFRHEAADEVLQRLAESELPADALSSPDLDVLYELTCTTISDRYLTDKRVFEFVLRVHLSPRSD